MRLVNFADTGHVFEIRSGRDDAPASVVAIDRLTGAETAHPLPPAATTPADSALDLAFVLCVMAEIAPDDTPAANVELCSVGEALGMVDIRACLANAVRQGYVTLDGDPLDWAYPTDTPVRIQPTDSAVTWFREVTTQQAFDAAPLRRAVLT